VLSVPMEILTALRGRISALLTDYWISIQFVT
jgi:hypothetical protein